MKDNTLFFKGKDEPCTKGEYKTKDLPDQAAENLDVNDTLDTFIAAMDETIELIDTYIGKIDDANVNMTIDISNRPEIKAIVNNHFGKDMGNIINYDQYVAMSKAYFKEQIADVAYDYGY